jgi:AcrR family transcriptional regulator
MTTTSSERRRGRPSDDALRHRRCEEILDAAARLFAQRGYAAANTQELADFLEVGKGTIYRYFPTKEELFLASVDRLVHRLIEAIDTAVAEVADPLDHIAAAITTYLRFAAEHPEFAELLVQERAQFKDRRPSTYFAYREQAAEGRHEYLRSLIQQGRVRDIDVERLFEVLGDVVYGTMIANYFTGRNRDPETQAADILEIVFHGILTDSERWRLSQRSAGAAEPFACNNSKRE